MMSDVPYQQYALVAQIEAELANARAYENSGLVEKLERQLKDLGVKKSAAEKRAESAEKKDDDGKKAEPEGRHAPKQHTT